MEAIHRIVRNGKKYERWYTTISDDFGSIMELTEDIPISAIDELIEDEMEITTEFVAMALQLMAIYKSKI